MKMKIKAFIGLGVVGTAIGTAIYAHKRHGGTMTLSSFKKSLSDMLSLGKSKASEVKHEVEDLTSNVTDGAQVAVKETIERAKSADGLGAAAYTPSGYTPLGGNRR